MVQKSRIETDLSDADLAEFRRLLATGRLTVDGMVMWLQGRGYEISRSSVGRFAKSYEEAAAYLRESRQITDSLVAELGEAATQGKQGRLLVELARSMVYDMLMQMRRDGETLDPKAMMAVGKGMAELAKALRYDQDFETKVEEVRKAAAAEAHAAATAAAAEVASSAARSQGLGEDQVAFLRARILGVPLAGNAGEGGVGG